MSPGMGPLEWDPMELDPRAQDTIYVWLDHDEMYISFDEVGPELIRFLEEGRFKEDARRVPFDRDPFER